MRAAGAHARGKSSVTPEVLISERPAEADERAVPGYREEDLVLGFNRSAICILIERTAPAKPRSSLRGFTMPLQLPPMEGHGTGVRKKNGPALAGHGAEAVCDAIAREITTLPKQIRCLLTWDQGAEMSQYARLRVDTGLAV